MSGQADNGDSARHERVAVVTLTYSLETFFLNVTGTCPTTELAKAICIMGADECENKIREKRTRAALEVATPELLAALQNRSRV